MHTSPRGLVSLVKKVLRRQKLEVIQLSTYAQQVATIEFYRLHWPGSSSQWSQDVFVLWVSNLLKGGTFLEIGGADGFTHSNTFSLERHHGWQGLLLEPDPEQFQILRQSRPRSVCRNTCISPEGLSDKRYRLRQLDQLSAIHGYEGSDMHSEARLQSRSFVNVTSESLNTVLAATAYDYFSLDVEGAELPIIQTLDWANINKPSVLTVEHNFREDDRAVMLEILAAQGYRTYFDRYPWLTRGDLWAALPPRTEVSS
jgi:FkbM family methyltransferase